MKKRFLFVPLAALACGALQAAGATLAMDAQTAAVPGAEPNSVVLVPDADDPAKSRLVGTAALEGLVVFDLAGRRVGGAPAGDVASVDAAHDVAMTAGPSTVLAAIDGTDNSLRFFTMRGDEIAEAGARAVPLGFAGEGVCFHRGTLDGALYAFVVGDGGEIDQHLVYVDAAGKIDARQVRRLAVPSTLTQCVVAPDGTLYAVEDAVGVWRMNANAEADTGARLVDGPGIGHIEEEAKGIALYDGGDGARWLLVSDTNAGRINVYDRADDDRYLGSVATGFDEPGTLFATSAALGDAFPAGLLAITDEEDGGNYKLVRFDALAKALGIASGKPRAGDADRAQVAVVHATHETAPAGSYGDAADDPAIWAHPADASKSLIVATDKKAGLYLYDMQGKVKQFLPVGKMNNVDLRDGFLLDGKPVTLVTASDRTRKAIGVFVLDGEAARLRDVAAGVQPTGLEDPYGLCMYRSPDSGKTYVFINSGDGPMHQWELVDAGHARVAARLVRKFRFESQTEGCVADDAAKTLFVGEEDTTLWRFGAEPDAPVTGTAVDTVEKNAAIKDDIEGMGLYDLGGGRGYVVVSSQGNDTYAVYRRESPHEYLGSFAVVADAAKGIDGISETDGLDVSSADLGPGFEHGAMVAQDGRNVLPVENQNYKIVPWTAIAAALKLELRTD